MPAAGFRVFVGALERLGYPPEALLAAAGVSHADLAHPDGRIACDAYGRLFAAAMAHRAMPNLGARLAATIPIGAFPVLDYLILTSETVGAALDQLSRYLRLVEAPYSLALECDQDPARLVCHAPPAAIDAEFALALAILHLREETGGRFQVLSVSFTHVPDDARTLQRLVGCPVHGRASWNGIELPRRVLDLPMKRRDAVLRAVLEQHAGGILARAPAGPPAATEVRRALAGRMRQGETRIEAVARVLAVSVRSLQRRLAEAGLSYQQLLEDTRRAAAAQYLSDPALSIGEVGYLLGYSEPAAFHRAFKRWHGVPPLAYRKRLGADRT